MILHERTLILDPDVFGGLTKERLEGLEKMGTLAALQVLKDHMVKALKERRAKGRGRARERGSKRMKGSGKRAGEVGPPSGGPFTNVPLERRPAAVSTDGGDITAVTDGTGDKPVATSSLISGSVPMDDGENGPIDVGSPIVVVDDSDEDGPAAKRRKIDDVPS